MLYDKRMGSLKDKILDSVVSQSVKIKEKKPKKVKVVLGKVKKGKKK